MAKVLIGYYSRTGNTKKMAEIIEKTLQEEGLDADNKKVEDIKVDELLNYDAIILSSPTYYGIMTWPIKN